MHIIRLFFDSEIVIPEKKIINWNIAGNCGLPLHFIHVTTSEAIHQNDCPFLPTFHHSCVSLPPSMARPHLSLSAVGACLSSPNAASIFSPSRPSVRAMPRPYHQHPAPSGLLFNVSWTCGPAFRLFFSSVPSLTVCGLLTHCFYRMNVCWPIFQSDHICTWQVWSLVMSQNAIFYCLWSLGPNSEAG